jgi:predicted nucleic acid-binding protein
VKPVFVDTNFLIALLNPMDQAADDASRLAESLREAGAELVTTDAVLIELANYFAARRQRARSLDLIRRMRTERGWTVRPLSNDLLARAERRYARHTDKQWSMTDCLSMEVMVELRLKDAATSDQHFRQAGFRTLL